MRGSEQVQIRLRKLYGDNMKSLNDESHHDSSEILNFQSFLRLAILIKRILIKKQCILVNH